MHLDPEQLIDLDHDRLPDHLARTARDHLGACDTCRERQTRVRAAADRVSDWRVGGHVVAFWEGRLRAALARARTLSPSTPRSSTRGATGRRVPPSSGSSWSI